MIGFYAAGAMGSGGGGSGSLYDAIMAHAPFMYLRHAEASGTTAFNDGTGPDGVYVGGGAVALGDPPLYASGPTSLRIAGTGGAATYPGAAVPALTSMTIGCVYRPANLSGIHHLIARDRDSGGGRFWQWRLDGADVAFIKLQGTPEAVTRSHGLSAATPALMVVTVAASGNVRCFVNGAKLGADQSLAPANYGGSDTTVITVGNRPPYTEGREGDRFSESFAIATDLSELDVMALAVAAGFA